MTANDSREELAARLRGNYWYGREFAYSRTLKNISCAAQPPAPAATLIIGPGQPCEGALARIRALLEHTGLPLEIICCQNGIKTTPIAPCLAISLNEEDDNRARKRNICALFASAPVLIFLEGNFLPDARLACAYLKSLRSHAVARGRITGLEGDIEDDVFFQADRGNEDSLWAMDLEENCAVRRDLFMKLGGFDETLSNGAHCLDFSCRMLRSELPASGQAYCATASGSLLPGRSRANPATALTDLEARYAGKMRGCAEFWLRAAKSGRAAL